ncbi:unnamed protein product, partial [Callosobruchus maculatus]
MRNFEIIDRSLFLMNIFGVHPAKVGSKIQFVVFLFFIINYLITTYWMIMYFILKDDKDVIMFITLIANVLCTVHALLYHVCLYVQRPKIMELLNDMQTNFWDIENYSNDDLRSTHHHTTKLLRIKYVMFCCMVFSCGLTYFYGRILEDMETVPENMLFESYIPDGMNFWVEFLLEHIPAYGLMLLEIALDFLICTILSLTTLQFKLLRYELERVFDTTVDQSMKISEKIRKCNMHHTFLLSFRTMLNDAFSMLMLAYIGVVVMILCMEIYLMFQMDSIGNILKTVVYSALMFFEFFICYCYPAQDLTDEADKLSESIYSSGWYDYPIHQKDVLMLTGKTQIQVIFTVGGILKLDLPTGMAVSFQN